MEGGPALGHVLSVWSVMPFALMLLGIALIPLWQPHAWEKHRNKALLSLVLGLPIAVYVGIHDAGVVARTAVDYAAFIVLLGSLYVISGGIVLRGDLRATPAVNTAFLAIGAVLANVIGTTGASMLLIRPLLQTNAPERKHIAHIPVFFIFVVSNCGGVLTPLGDPPLFLGYLRGVPFFWTMRLLPQWAFALALILILFWIIDRRAVARETASSRQRDIEDRQPLSLQGRRNFLYLFGVVVIVLFSPRLPEGAVREGVRLAGMLLMTALSLATTPAEYRRANGFTFGPIQEVAVLFAGIFATMPSR